MNFIINPDRFDELCAMDEDGGHDTLKALVNLYLDSTPPQILAIKNKMLAKDVFALKYEAHNLRSSSLNIGAERIAALCEKIEYLEDVASIASHLPALENEFADVRATLTDIVGKLDTDLEQMSRIVQLQQDIATSDRPLQEQMDFICHKTQAITNATGAVVELNVGEEMVYEACTGSVAGQKGLRLNLQRSLSGLSVLQSKVIYCRDSEKDDRVDINACRLVGARSMICVPLKHKTKTVGVLKVLSREPDHFSDKDVRGLKIIAGLLSASIAQASAYALLSESEQKFRTLVEASYDAIVISRQGIVLDVNKSFLEMFHFEKSEIINKIALVLAAPEYREVVQANIARDYSEPYQIMCLRGDGSVFNAEVVGKIIEINGEKSRMTTVRDITVKLAAENSLRESERLSREASQMKSHFLANMSHEIRTPLNGILGMATILSETSLDEDQKRYVQILRKSTDNLLVIINDLLDFSKIEANKIRLEQIPFELRPTLEDLMPGLRHAALKNDVKVNLTIDNNVPTWVKGDPGRLSQIILNLGSNAVKFTKNGTVDISVRALGEKIKFSIQDSGIGIPKESIPQLFTPFTQVDASTTRKYGGTGLGLSICKQLTEKMDGTIGVISEPDKGSLFWFELPLAEVNAPDMNKSESPVSASRTDKLRILLVEDNDTNILIVKVLLESLGHVVTVAKNGLEAISTLEKAEFDMTFMDCQMPEMDGFEATKRIRASKATYWNIPIIAMTAYAMDGDKEKCIEAGMSDYTSKPVRKKDLAAAIERVMKK